MQSTSDGKQLLIEELHHIYANVNDMLKFAEAKNAGLVAVNVAIIIGVCQISLLSSDKVVLVFIGWYVISLNVISAFFALISTVAHLKSVESVPKFDPTLNLLYFGSLALFTPQELVSQIVRKYKFESTNEPFEFDMARQIIIVSQITLRKFRLFNIAINFTFASIPPIPIFSFIYDKFFNPNK